MSETPSVPPRDELASGSAEFPAEPPPPAAPRQPARPPAGPRPVLTFLLVAANVGVFWMQVRDPAVSELYSQSQIHIWGGELYRLVTALFLHGFLGHLVLNCLGLLVLGVRLEPLLGRWRFLALYFLSGLGGAFAFQGFSAGEGVGASGAVYGLVGGLAVAFLGRVSPKGHLQLRLRFFVFVAALFVIDWFVTRQAVRMMMGDAVEIAHSAHLGGLISGAAFGYVFVSGRLPTMQSRRRRLAATFAALLVLFGAYACYRPVYNPVWQAWRALDDLLERGDADADEVRRVATEAGSMGYVEWATTSSLERARRLRAEAGAAVLRDDGVRAEALGREARRQYAQAGRVWESIPPGIGLRWQIGFSVWDAMMAAGLREDARQVLDSVASSCEVWFKSIAEQEDVPKDSRALAANNYAWVLAVRGDERDMREASETAELALRLFGMEHQGDWWPGDLGTGRNELEGVLLNTRGWVRFVSGENIEDAMRDLRRATELAPMAANWLYLGIAHRQLGNDREAKAAAAEAVGGQRTMTEYERVLLEELCGDLGIGVR